MSDLGPACTGRSQLISREALSLSVLEHVNRVRMQPAKYAEHLRQRLAGCYNGKLFSPPWRLDGDSVKTSEGEAALVSLVAELERTPPLPMLQSSTALEWAAQVRGNFSREVHSGSAPDHARARCGGHMHKHIPHSTFHMHMHMHMHIPRERCTRAARGSQAAIPSSTHAHAHMLMHMLMHVPLQAMGQQIARGVSSAQVPPIETRLADHGTWSGVSGEAVIFGMHQPEEIATMLLLCDGEPTRKNRSFVLNAEVRFGAYVSSDVADHPSKVVGVLSLLSDFHPRLDGEHAAEFEGPIDARSNPMPLEVRANLQGPSGLALWHIPKAWRTLAAPESACGWDWQDPCHRSLALALHPPLPQVRRILEAIPSSAVVDKATAALHRGEKIQLVYREGYAQLTIVDRAQAEQRFACKWQ